MSMGLDRETAMRSAQKFRLMQKGNIVLLVSLAAVLVNAILNRWLLLHDSVVFSRSDIGMMMLFMVISVAAGLIGNIIYLAGLYGMVGIRPEYQKAFLCELVLIILGLVYNALGQEGVLAETVDAIQNLGVLLVLWLVLQGTRCLLESLGQEAVLRRGQRVWKLYVLAELIDVLLIVIHVPVTLSTEIISLLVFAVAMVILGIVAAVDYTGYLGQAAKAMEQAMGPEETEQA